MMVQQSLMDVERQVVDQIGSFLALSDKRDEVLTSFISNMNYHFDELLDKETIRQEVTYDFENLSLVLEEEFDVMLVLESMVNAAREKHLEDFVSFHARLSLLFPNKRLDESTNPLEAEQIASAFQEALRPLGLDAPNTLTVYRAFEKSVLDNLDEIFQEAEKILVASGVKPDPSAEKQKKQDRAATRTRKSRDWDDTFNTVEEVEEEEIDGGAENANVFSMMQNLMHGDNPAAPASAGGPMPVGSAAVTGDGVNIPEGHVVVPANQLQQYMVPAAMNPGGNAGGSAMQPFQPAAGQQVQMVDQTKLMEILNNIQKSLGTNLASTESGMLTDNEEVDITESLGEMLIADQEDGVINAVDRESSDVINLVTLLYEAIWDDDAVPIPIKELIGRTQITVIKTALSDDTFFNDENHPVRAILNEFAAAGIGWTEVEKLQEDPLYKKIHELVEKILLEYDADISFFEDLIKEFRNFRAKEAAETRRLEQSILKTKESEERLNDINELVTQKIDERILGRELNTFVRDLLEIPFHEFMVKLVLKEGPGSSAWKQAINTIDVLLWSVQPHEQSGDRARLKTVNPRLLKNLRKAFRIASVESDEINSLISDLQNAQEESFTTEDELLEADQSSNSAEGSSSNEDSSVAIFTDSGKTAQTEESTRVVEWEQEQTPAEKEAEEYGAYLEQVEAMTVGTWVEIVGEDEQNTRCKLEAKINAIDKFIFVNRQGIKVVEKTKIGLARELKEESVRIISDGLLFSRALESVIGTLRENQLEQQTGGAYQPTV